ncbi:glycosyltransferase family 8 protein [Hymenobacter norwichensis]|uniref:glycosyltransferase family 8 protein n=1 Tax=Hymenobacter norwichensis TaxID=223903 RepID=UPI0003B6860B|nr:glycosyltransferase family 8 protein [Hymenobacter norwichensis]
MLNIVFNINSLGLEGLGATLTSLIRNCSNPHELKIWFLCSDLTDKDQNNIIKLLSQENFYGYTEFIFFNARKEFGHLKSLHGDWTAYGRLLIADYVDSDTALYLDADLIIMIDVLTLKKFELQDNILAAVYGSNISQSLESTFFINELNYSPQQKYFNSGVLLFNLKKWRENNINYDWKAFASKYPDRMLTADQTILNAICKGEFAHLPAYFNNPWYARQEEPINSNDSILHFVGSPKPWDIFGNIIHAGHKVWLSYTSQEWKKNYHRMSFNKLYRSWKIKNSLLRNIKLINR